MWAWQSTKCGRESYLPRWKKIKESKLRGKSQQHPHRQPWGCRCRWAGWGAQGAPTRNPSAGNRPAPWVHIRCKQVTWPSGTTQAPGISGRKYSNTDLHIVRVSDLTEQAQNLPHKTYLTRKRGFICHEKVNAALMEVCALFKSVAPYRLEEVESCRQRPWDFRSVLQLLWPAVTS